MTRPHNRAAGRVVSRGQLGRDVAAWREAGLRVVLASGVFDLLGVAHVRYLRGARALGERLVVAVTGDRAAALEGPGLPVVGEGDRALLVAALRGVDRVVIWEEQGMEALIAELRPAAHAAERGASESVPGPPTSPARGGADGREADPGQGSSRELYRRIRERGSGS